MNRAKSTRRVRLLSRIGSPTCRLHTGRPWLSPSSRSLPRTTVHRVSLANTRRHASTWSSRSAKRARRASGAGDLHERFELPRVHVLAVARDVPPAREHQPRPGRRVVEHRLGRSRRVAVDAPRDEHDQHPVAPRDRPRDDLAVVRRSRNTVMRPVNASSFSTLSSRQTPTTSWPRSSACWTMYCPSFPEAPTMQTLRRAAPPRPRSARATRRCR